MRVLVTGNLGYIGTVLSKALLDAGHEVHGYDQGLYYGFSTGPLPLVETFIGDIRDASSLRKAMVGVDAVIHLAGLANDPLGDISPEVTREVNLHGSLKVEAVSDGRPLVMYSSASVYGAAESPCSEDAPTNPLSLYAECKLMVDDAMTGRPQTLILRNGTVHGPSPMMRTDLLVNTMVASAMTTGQVVLTTDPSTLRPVVDVRDLANLTVGLLERKVYGLYNVASTNLQVGGAAVMVAAETGATIVTQYDKTDPRNYAVDTTKLSKAAPWWKTRTIQESISDIHDYYREIGLTVGQVDRYRRIAQYKVSA